METANLFDVINLMWFDDCLSTRFAQSWGASLSCLRRDSDPDIATGTYA